MRYSITVAEDNVVLGSFVKAQCNVSSRRLQQLFRKGQVLVNGKKGHSKRMLRVGDVVSVPVDKDSNYGVEPEQGPLRVLYEDDQVLVVYKPVGIAVHPMGHTTSHTLANWVAGYYANQRQVITVRPVHRLDVMTDGCVVFAKTKAIQQYYTEGLHAGRLERYYRTLVRGIVPQDGTVDAPIGMDPRHKNRRKVLASGKRAITHYKVLYYANEYGEASDTPTCTWLDCQLETGRTHQIRVHMQHIGHPIVGDAMYGGGTGGQRLMAYEVQLQTEAGQTIVVTCDK